MIYGLYLSASGVLTNSYRQDVIANNLANSETVGFKKDLALLQQRPTAAQELGRQKQTDPLLENIGGGLLASHSAIDTRAGDFQPTGNNFDFALEGQGYFAVADKGKTFLTRNGQFMVNRSGNLILADGSGNQVLDDKQKPITVDGTQSIAVSNDGTLTQGGKAIARLGLFNLTDPTQLKKVGGTLLSPLPDARMTTATPVVRNGFVERSNVDPATELTELMDTQRELEANANMIHIQDETLDKLVNDIGKVS
jgi:flagellar basal-body rod protein FlgF